MAGHTFAGIGQPGHNREDRDLHEHVCDALERHPSLDADGIEVLADDNEIFLIGTVFSENDRSLAEHVARSVAGVRAVYNRLDLFSNGPVAESNLAIESTISGAVRPTQDGSYDPTS